MLNFIVWAPEYHESSGGIMVLHLLAKDLANEGHNVLIGTQTTIEGSLAKTLSDSPVSFDPSKTMAIYPEIVSGNPFEVNAGYVTRWLLNTPGVISGDGKFGDNDLVYKYLGYFKAPDESKVKGYLRTMDAKLDLYVNRGQDRSGECYMVKKGGKKKLDKHSPHSVNIDVFKGNEYLANLFNEKETFISYDSTTYHSIQAALCGCLSIVIPDEGVTKEEYFEKIPHFRYGIAYGMDDIQHAKETQHLLRDVIQGVEDECKVLVRSYINECYKLMKINKSLKIMAEVEISVLVVNLNNLEFTRNCISDLLNQDQTFKLKLIDQNSSEQGTSEYLEDLIRRFSSGELSPSLNYLEVLNHGFNKPLNHIWNEFANSIDSPFGCILNNDVRIPPNFLSSSLEVLKKEESVGFVSHPTNHHEFRCWGKQLKYKIMDFPYRQGWDFTFRKSDYSKIPDQLQFFFGDDFIFNQLYSAGKRGAYVLNSPMIHFERSTTIEKGGQRDCSIDGDFFYSLDLEFKNLDFVGGFSKWKPEFLTIEYEEMKSKAYITHVTRDYLEIALNLAKSIRLFSELPLIVYCINLEQEDQVNFTDIDNVFTRNIDLNIEESVSTDYIKDQSGNFYVNRGSSRIYKILCAKTIAMEMALEEGWDEVCYLDSDCLATPLVDEIFDWIHITNDYPIATEGIHDYMMLIRNGIQIGNPFEGTWPNADNTKCLEWPMMSFLELSPYARGRYRTTGIMLMTPKCLPFIKTWKDLCYILPKLVDLERYAPYHEETIYNVLCWKKTNEGFPLCYINLGEGLETVKHTYSDEATGGHFRWSDEDHSQRFYAIPDDKRNIKVLHGEKRTSEVNLILDFLNGLKSS